ncbi:MAG: chemotaxis protein CheW [Candidatus Binatia bacterium]
MEFNQLLVFTLENQRYALDLSAVQRVVRMVEITPLPKAPEMVLGVVNLQGDIIPVVNIRKRFGLPEREINLSDALIFARTERRRLAVAADSVSSVIQSGPEQIVKPERIAAGIEYVAGVVKLPDGMILIHDLAKFFSLDEERMLDQAVNDARRD